MYDLRNLRRRAGWTQAELARRLAVAQSYLSDVEAGKRELSVNAATKAAHVFGVPLSRLRQDTHDAGVVARLGPIADVVKKATRVAAKSATARSALVAELDDLIDRVGENDELDDPAAVRRVLRALRKTLAEDSTSKSVARGVFGRRLPADPERDLAGRKRRPQTGERDAYGRKVAS